MTQIVLLAPVQALLKCVVDNEESFKITLTSRMKFSGQLTDRSQNELIFSIKLNRSIITIVKVNYP